MKLKLHHLIYAGILIALGVIFLGRGGPEKAIARHVKSLAAQIEKTGDESGLALAERSRALGEAFTDPFTIDLAPYGLEIADRGTLARHFAAYRLGTETIEARFADIDVDIAANERSATVLAVAVLTAKWQDARPGRERYRLQLDYVLIGGDWKIERLILLEVLEGPDRLF